MNKLAGKRTYVVSGAMIVFALSGLLTDQLPYDRAMELIFTALGFTFLRKAVK